MTSSGLTRCFEPTSPTSEMANADKDSAPLLLDLVSFTLVDGILYHRDRKAVAWPLRRLPLAPLQLVVPPQLRQAILRGHHESVLAARGGINATYMAIRQRYWWRNLLGDVVDYVKSCTSCAAINPNLRGPASGFLPQGPVYRPFEDIVMDFLGPLPPTSAGNTDVLVVMDYFTRRCETFALPDATAATTAKVLINRGTRRFAPSLYSVESGAPFTAETLRVIVDLFSTNNTSAVAIALKPLGWSRG